MKSLSRALAGLALLAAASCGYEAPVTQVAGVSVVRVAPDSVDVALGDTVTFTATVVDVTGGLVTDRAVSWSVSGGTAAAIEASSGLATAMHPGVATVVATVEGVRGTARMVVPGFGVDSVLVSPDSAEVRVGGTAPFTVATFAADGSPIVGAEIAWSTANPAVATVDAASGLVTGVAPGVTTVTATSEGVSDAAVIAVSLVPVDSVLITPDSAEIRVGQGRTYLVEVFDSTGIPLAGRAVAWSTGDPAVATVDAAGTVTGAGPGITSVVALSEGVADTAIVAVSRVPVDAVVVSPDSVEIRVGGTAPFTAVLLDSAGVALADRAVAWTTGDPAVATVDPGTGLVSGVAPGVTTVVAVSEGVADTARVTVSRVPVDSVRVSPDVADVAIGETTPYTAAVFDSTGAALTGRTVAWSTGDTTVARVDPASGVVTGVAVGSTSVIATSEGVSDSAVVNVFPVAVDSVLVSPDSAEVRVGYTTALSAQLFDNTGAPLAGRVVAWSTGNPAVAMVDAGTGVVTGVAPGTTTVVATSEGVSDSAILVVSLAPVDSVRVSPDSAEVRIGHQKTYAAAVFDSTGVALDGRGVTWSTGDPGIASVDAATGVVTGVSAGTTTVVATSEGISDSALVTVSPAPVAALTISPDSADVAITRTTAFTAAVFDSTGAALANRTVAWVSADPAIASVDPLSGVVTGVAEGRTTVTATSEGISDSAIVKVFPIPVDSVRVSPDSAEVRVGYDKTYAAAVFDALGNPLSGRLVSWSTGNASVATVDPATGVVNGVSAGTTTVVATSEGITDAAIIVVSPAPVAAVTVSPPTAEIRVGGTTSFTAALADSTGQPLAGRTVTWSSTAPGVATVDPGSGLVNGVAVGAAGIVATSEGVSDTASVTVSAVPVASVTVTPDPAEVRVGGTAALSVTVVDSAGNTVTDRAVLWSSADEGVVTVDGSGVLTGVALGTTTVTATSEGVSYVVAVNVTAIPVGTVTVTPDPAEVRIGGTAQLAVEVRDSLGTVVTDRTVSWTALDAATVTVNGTGVVTGQALGSGRVVAASEGVADTVTVNVSRVPVGTVAVTPDPTEVRVGGTAQLTATVRDSLGAVVTDRGVSWTTLDPGVVAVSGTGIVTGQAVGSGRVVATSEGVADTATVNVTPIPVGTVTVNPPAFEIRTDGSFQLTATVQDSLGTVVTDRTVTWSSGDGSVATVDPGTGLVTGSAVGTTTITATSEGKSGSSTVTVSAIPVASVTVTPDPAAVREGGTVQMTTTLVDSAGNTVTGRVVTWGSGDPSVATINPNTGLVTGVTAGSTTVTATSEGIPGTATVNVSQVPVSQVLVEPATASLAVGRTAQFTAAVLDSAGNALLGRPVAWTTDDGLVATIDAGTGLATGVAVGSTTLRATSEGVEGTAALQIVAEPVGSVTVAPPSAGVRVGYTTTYTVTVLDGGGSPLTDRVVTWSTANLSIATVNPVTGEVTGVAPGITEVFATSEGVFGSAFVEVTAAPVETVAIAPDGGAIRIGGTLQLSAALADSTGRPLTGRAVTWSSEDGAVASVDPATGLVLGVGAGSTSIIASSEGVADTVSVSVTTVPVGSVSVAPDPAEVRVGGTVQLAATVLDSLGAVVTDRTVIWTSLDEAVATVDPTGLVSGIAVGTASVVAESEGVADTVTVDVSLSPVGSVTVTPDPAEARVGGTVQLTAEVRDTAGTVVLGRTVDWLSEDETVATVDADGLVTGLTPGTVNITATSDAVSGSSSVTISLVPVGTVTVSPDPSEVAVGASTQLTATLVDSAGNPAPGRDVAWSSADEAVATVDAGGVVTGVAVGSTTITATSEGVSGNATVNVVQIPVDSVLVSPDSQEVRVGYTKTFTAQTFDALGAPLAGRALTWSTGDPAVATADPATGVVTGVAAGVTSVIATSEGVSDSAVIAVSIPLVESVLVSPDSIDLRQGGAYTFSAAALDSTGAAIPGKPAAWTSSAPGVATIDPASGEATAVGLGITTITAEIEGFTDSAVLSVSRPLMVAYGRDPSRVWVFDAGDGAGETALTAGGGGERNPAWSPDGNRIAYVATVGSNGELFIMGADGSNPTQLTSNNFFDAYPSFSPDGTRLVYTSQRGSNRDVYIYDLAAGTTSRLMSDSGSDELPKFSPDGTRIVFQSDRNGGDWEIYVMNADGSNQVRLTTSAGFDGQPEFSPDGTRIVFTSERDGNREVYSMAADGTDVVRLTSDGGTDEWPSYAPDGSSIVFSSARSGGVQVWVMDANGANPVQRSTGAPGLLGPKFQPLGR